MLNPVEVEALYPLDKVLIYKNGLLIQRKARFKYPKKYSPRKGIYEMSKKSRLLLTHIVSNSQIKFKSMFTLTYGDFMPPVNGKELKRQFNIFLKAYRKRFRTPEYVWFLEFQKNNKPHIHVITTVSPSANDRVWLGALWSKISVKDAWKRLEDNKVKDYEIKKGLDVAVLLDEWEKSKKVHTHKKCWELFYKEDGATRYCLKYATKAEQKLVPSQFQNVGRFWGTSDNVHPQALAELVIGETMSDEGFRKIFKGERIENYPLLPRYVFQRDAIEHYSQKGLKLTEIFDSSVPGFIDRVEGDVIELKNLTKQVTIAVTRHSDQE